MEKLSPQQLAQLHRHLIHNGSDDALVTELVDHMACEVEHYMWIGLPFETAIEKALLEANPNAVAYLTETYQREFLLAEEQTQTASLDDIVFEYRNKAYGAYHNRQMYKASLWNALFASIGIFLMIVGLSAGMKAGKWTYLSLWGGMWLVGLCCLIYSFLSWYIQRMRHHYSMPEEMA